MSRNLGLPGFDEGRGKSSERTIELRAALGYVALMAAKIYSLSREVREAALDLKTIQRRIPDAGHRAYEWYPAQAGAQTVIDLANSPSFEDKALMEFFETSERHLLPARPSGRGRRRRGLSCMTQNTGCAQRSPRGIASRCRWRETLLLVYTMASRWPLALRASVRRAAAGLILSQ